MGEITDSLVIIAILILNAVLGVVQEWRASQALEALKKMTVPECEVIREGKPLKINSEEIAVSYTHLDVYKRQAPKSMMRMLKSCRGSKSSALIS